MEWAYRGALIKRINFAAGILGDVDRPGVQAIVGKLQSDGDLSPEEFVEACLDLVGPSEVKASTREELVEHASRKGSLTWSSEQAATAFTQRVGEIVKLIASIREFQYS